MKSKDTWQPTTRVPMPLTAYDLDGATYWKSPDVLLSNMDGEYAVGWAELTGPWEMIDGQMVGREGAEIIWGADASNDFVADLWLPIPARPNGTIERGGPITLASVSMYLKTVAEAPPPSIDD